MTIPELGVSIFTESIGITLHRKRDSQGFEALQHDAYDAGQAGKQAREAAEAALGERVVSSQNFIHLKKVKGRKSKRTLPSTSSPQPNQPTLFDDPDSADV